jgi:hypothetical protein
MCVNGGWSARSKDEKVRMRTSGEAKSSSETALTALRSLPPIATPLCSRKDRSSRTVLSDGLGQRVRTSC